MVISYGDPDHRLLHLEKVFDAKNIQTETIKCKSYDDGKEKEITHYVYICKKTE